MSEPMSGLLPGLIPELIPEPIPVPIPELISGFMIRFGICNLILCGIIGLLFGFKWLFRKHLTSRMQYNLYIILLGLLAVPFLPLPLKSGLLSIGRTSPSILLSKTGTSQTASQPLSGAAEWMNDFAVSVNDQFSPVIGTLFFGVWIFGMLVMVFLLFRFTVHLHQIEQSALPLQNPQICRLYKESLHELDIRKEIPVYSTAFLKSPMIVGVFRPKIYVPMHLISDHRSAYDAIHYMMLHELQHYKHKDTFIGYLMNLASIVYWFHPLVWFALKEMKNERELACDASVLQMLDEKNYIDYGNTLLDFAEKLADTPFPFASGLSSNMKQMKHRILNIASYQCPDRKRRLKNALIFSLIAALLIGCMPFLSTVAADEDRYHWNSDAENVVYSDFSENFGAYEGSFVLYNSRDDCWNIYDQKQALQRVAPNSTYKIYDALFGLEENIITPEDSFIKWNGETYPFTEWNQDQTLSSAMASSVNWYFQSIDQKLGRERIDSYLEMIGYGNESLSGDLSSYWMESSLQISPIEQVELLIDLYNNHLNFSAENIAAVKNALLLSSSDDCTLYGKTGTGNVNGSNVNGWFVGYAETSDNTYFFATNIRAESHASGSHAAEITLELLKELKIPVTVIHNTISGILCFPHIYLASVYKRGYIPLYTDASFRE